MTKKETKTPSDSKAPAAAETKADAKTDTKTDSGEKAADPAKTHVRGEGQKPTSDAYRSNWQNIFGKKKKPRRK